ncbi:hypothetical protein ACFS5M_02175 [Lacinutrix iliipiscaria]|uniref:GOLD domain-containing protein n=1 Tax=Lacinutrix iliipiscaria TaxID=1230532 RepID=A0ABW5WKU0_9FLAO
MKKILFILFALSLYSCSLGDDGINTHTELLPVESAILPEEFILGNLHLIKLTYLRPSTCHAYNDIYYVADSNERTVAIVTTVFENNDCEEISAELEAEFNFRATELGSYIFKFWQGTDDTGEDLFVTYEIPVVEE